VNLFDEYCKDHEIGFGGDYRDQKRADRLKRRLDRVSKLQDEDLSEFSSREQAEEYLNSRAVSMVGPVTFWIMSSIIRWLIIKLLDRWFNDNNSSS